MTMSMNIRTSYEVIRNILDFKCRLNNRIKKSPEEYSECLQKYEDKYTNSFSINRKVPIKELLQGTYYFEEADDK